MKSEEAKKLFPKDIIEKAEEILKQHPYGVGPYSQSAGIPFVREKIAEFINERDGIITDPENIFLTDGASKGIQSILYSIIKNSNDGILVPIPQYPLYSASIELYGGTQVNYFLDEEKEWSLNEQQLEESISKAKSEGINPVAIVVINPGNPTGAVLSEDNIKLIINFAKKNNLVILADEVYQENIYLENLKFISFSKVMQDLKETEVSLFSFHSVSKGYIGECGHRGGYMEMRNVPNDVAEQLLKLQSISLCPNIPGQLVTYLMINPPKEGDESYEVYIKEKTHTLNSLHERANILAEGLNKIEGVSLNIPQGAMYAFVKVELPEDKNFLIENEKRSPAPEHSDWYREKALYYAKRNVDYCMAMLEETGVCVVPGSGFGQKEGTYHFRVTFLPPVEQIRSFVEKFERFHLKYSAQ